MASAQRLKLKQMPLDSWAVREKLCLAMSVQRSGDQNWVSVSRAIRPFGENDRPADWFSQKNCASQYSDMLEKTETPKRKRGERIEIETPGDLIVRKLTYDRIDELKKLLHQENMQCKKFKKEIETIKNGQMDDRLDEIWKDIQDQKNSEEIAAQESKKFYEEREARIKAHKLALRTVVAPMKNRRPPAQQLKILQSQSQDDIERPDSTQSPLSEPLSVDVNDDPMTTEISNVDKAIAVSASVSTSNIISTISTLKGSDQQIHVNRPVHPSPTSPLLSSLLKSPTPNTPGGPGPISPAVSSLFASVTGNNQNKEASSNNAANTKTASPNSPFISPTSARQPSTMSPSAATSPAVMSLFSDVSGTPVTPLQTSPSAGAPTLSKLLEMPPSTSGRLPPLPVVASEASQIPAGIIKSEINEEMFAASVPLAESNESKSGIAISEEVSSTIVDLKSDKEDEMLSDEIAQKDVADEQVIDASNVIDKKSENNAENVKLEDLANASKSEETNSEAVEVQKPKDKDVAEDDDQKNKRNDRESAKDAKSDDKEVNRKSSVDTPVVVKKVLLKNDKVDSDADTPTSSTPRTGRYKGVSRTKRGRRGRGRFGRSIPIIDSQIMDEESNTFSSAPATPDTSAVESNDTTTAGMETSEDESILITGGKISIPSTRTASTSDSIPNSPVSQIDDPESMKDYRTWKRAIMLVWREAANHRYANVFLHPVTDDHAPGYSVVVHRPMDLSTIKKNIENGIIKSTMEFQRDLLLMFQNAILYNNSNQYVYKMAVGMQDEVMQQVQNFVATQLMVRTTESKVLRGRTSESGKRSSVVETSDSGKDTETSSKRRKSIPEETRGKKKHQS